MDRKHKISTAFGETAPFYHKTASIQKNAAKRLLSFLPTLKKGRIFELGCGTGYLTNHIIARYPDCSLHISDLSSKMLIFTRHHSLDHRSIQYSQIDLDRLPEKSEDRYDLIITSMALQWSDAPLTSLKHLQQFLKPDGALFYSTLQPDNFPEWHQTLKALDYPNGLLQTPHLPGEIYQEKIPVQYTSSFEFFKTLQKQGTALPATNYIPLKPGQLRKALQHMDQHFNGIVSWHITYGKLGRPRAIA